jgi:serine/threonine protein kinase
MFQGSGDLRLKFDMLTFIQAEILTRIHHMNLVSMIGYCMDGAYMALVYEYMSEGTLEEHIKGM